MSSDGAGQLCRRSPFPQRRIPPVVSRHQTHPAPPLQFFGKRLGNNLEQQGSENFFSNLTEPMSSIEECPGTVDLCSKSLQLGRKLLPESLPENQNLHPATHTTAKRQPGPTLARSATRPPPPPGAPLALQQRCRPAPCPGVGDVWRADG